MPKATDLLRLKLTQPWPVDTKSTARWLMAIVLIVSAYVWSIYGTNFSIRELIKGLPFMQDIVSRMLPPNLNILPKLIGPTLETIQISILGTTLAILFCIPFGILAAKNISSNPLIYHAARFVLNATRSISEIIFALIFVAALGLGPFPGVMAVAVHSIGMLGKFLAESIENIDPGPVEALTATGASSVQIFRYAIFPQILPEFITLCLYRWELNFRSATILGVVGAGGIGFELITSMRLFKYQDMTTVLVVILATVTIVDFISSKIRSKII